MTPEEVEEIIRIMITTGCPECDISLCQHFVSKFPQYLEDVNKVLQKEVGVQMCLGRRH